MRLRGAGAGVQPVIGGPLKAGEGSTQAAVGQLPPAPRPPLADDLNGRAVAVSLPAVAGRSRDALR
eukprot:8826466-Lingulodinium_polyedra.AAC.1